MYRVSEQSDQKWALGRGEKCADEEELNFLIFFKDICSELSIYNPSSIPPGMRAQNLGR